MSLDNLRGFNLMQQHPIVPDLAVQAGSAEDPTYVALHQAEERACRRYLVARKELITLAARAASLGRLVTEHPYRQDYQAEWRNVVLAQSRAVTRTGSAWTVLQRARNRTDTAQPAPALSGPFTSAFDADGEVA
jgi:hypothetical protein